MYRWYGAEDGLQCRVLPCAVRLDDRDRQGVWWGGAAITMSLPCGRARLKQTIMQGRASI
jgi:hypothetical protein